MEELKNEATELGLDFKGNISRKDLEALVEDAKNQTADGSEPDSRSNSNPLSKKKIKLRISPRDSEEKEGYVGICDYSAQYQFDEDVEMPEYVVDFIRSKGGYQTNGKGEKKWVSRYLIELL